MENYDERIGANIRSVRKKAGLSQSKLADKCQFSNTVLSNYETGERTPSLQTLAKIAKQLGVSIDRLYYGDEAEVFITAEPDIGRKVVNAVYLLWEQGVISIYNYWQIGYPPFSDNKPNRLVLYVNNYDEQIQRLIMALDEYKAKKSTFDDPEQYLESIKSSVANEINRMKPVVPLGDDDLASVIPPKKKKSSHE